LIWNFWSAVICARPWRANASVRGLGLSSRASTRC